MPATVGIARSKTLAKLISDTAKPFGALAILDRASEESLLAARPVTDVTGIAGRRAGNPVFREPSGAVELSGRRHAGGGVDRDERGTGRRDGLARGEERPRERERKEDERCDAESQQQQLAQATLLAVLDRRVPQQLDRREQHARLRLALEQVQDYRDRGRERSCQKHRR